LTAPQDIRRALAGVPDPVALLEGMFALAPFGLQIYSAAGRSLVVNQAFLNLFGSEPPPEYSVLEDEIAQRAGVLGHIRRAFQGEVVRLPVTWYDPRELRQVHIEQGNRVAIDTTFFPLFDRHGTVTHVAVMFKDVTAEQLAREEVEAERDLLSRAAHFREQLLGVVGHDLRTPLAAIVAGVGVILRHEELPPAVGTTAARIASAADRMRRMIADLLDFTQARLGAGLPVSLRETDLAPIVEQVGDEVAAGHPGRVIESDVSGDLHGSFDPDRIAQLLGNLLENAMAYGPADDPVRVEARGEAAHLALAVENGGPELAPEDRAGIFDPFRRGESARTATQRGLGLGLFIVDHIARAHRGSVSVTSAPGRTRFEVKLPRQR
jgi:signal transduction histidine kinase